MQIRENVALKDYTTMRLGGPATALTEVTTKEELVQAVEWAETKRLPILVLGGGSNVIFSNGYKGLVILNRISGFDVLSENSLYTTIKIGAGEVWDPTVARTVTMGLSGIEALSAIPGTVGGTPVQNVGAYGQEIADTLIELEVYDTKTHSFSLFDNAACDFKYRWSKFKPLHERHYIITSITLRLRKANPEPPFYASLQKYLDEHAIATFTPQTIRDAVKTVRAKRLPDPQLIANTGSFFKNPIIDAVEFASLAAKHGDMPHWETNDGRIKLSAGWLIEHAGLKGYANYGMKVYEHNALVFVNEAAQNYSELAAFREEVVQKVIELFSITLEQEPELL